MKRTEVKSIGIASIGYDYDTNVLEIEFTSGNVYQYEGVPDAIYWKFINSKNIGKYFNREIKDYYDYQKIENE